MGCFEKKEDVGCLVEVLTFPHGNVATRTLLEKSTTKAHASEEVWTGSNPFSNSSRVAFREECRKAAVFFSYLMRVQRYSFFFTLPNFSCFFLRTHHISMLEVL